MKSIKLSWLAALLLLTTLPSCGNDDDSNSECRQAICTQVFVMIDISVTDQNQNPVALDSFEVTNIENGEDMTIQLTPNQFEMAQQTGMYPLITDGILGVNQERQLRLKGFINGQEVVSSDYTVTTDCCHVGLVEGELQLSL